MLVLATLTACSSTTGRGYPDVAAQAENVSSPFKRGLYDALTLTNLDDLSFPHTSHSSKSLWVVAQRTWQALAAVPL